MEVSYKKDLRNNYLVVEKKDNNDEEAYCVRMILANSITGIIKPEQRNIDGQILYYYDISSKQPLDIIYEKKPINFNQVNKLFTGLIEIMEQAYEFLLNENDLVMEPAHIYIDISTEQANLCYVPGYNKDIRKQIANLIEYIMNKIDYKDKEAVLLVYNLYAICRKDSFSYEDLLSVIRKKSRQDSKIEIEEIGKGEREESKPEAAIKDQIPNEQIPVMMEKILDDQEHYYFPLKTYIYTGICCLCFIFTLILSIKSKLIYTFFGTRIDYSKFMVLLLILLCIMGYVLRKIWDKKNRLTKLIRKEEYIDPRKEDISLKASIEDCLDETLSKSNRDLLNNNDSDILNPTVLLNEARVCKCYLEPINHKINKIIEMDNFPFVIGKYKNNVDYLLDKEVVSRYHLKITMEDDKYYITDLNSTNGTYLNEKPLPCYKKHEIVSGDEVSIAGIKYIFRLDK
ncbi:DUF6382 domain-containing protein [Herbinix luporum]|uniref:FHA domain-containing protein n=2 Tax=Herbinix luporum TaxID=1679721 RepID=A0A0K8J2J7_9FIRM|nr:DUF6382 domain-containing protein [Herbinix luporum]CUH91614.1 hypothetical protein SD1D_0051 [Herbinix luporum]HHT56422.1 FHA domain-containing protein [Herbinix luporum]